ncbi:MAG: amidohydrolase family protein, partial [Gemmatimonadetes bacterium]|nr:amidohydrolase family protein [Gemmatimonadota bacterium]
PNQGNRSIDASGHMVAPGFIDILSSIRPERKTHEDKAADGVTTAIGLHGGPIDVAGYVERHMAVPPILNFAATVDHRACREAAGITDRYAAATPEQIPGMKECARQAIRDGAAGVGFGLNYSPGASYEETFAMFEVAGEFGVMAAPHARYKGNVFPLTMSLATMEAVSMAAATGASLQMIHLISSTVGSAPLSIDLIEGAQARGVDVGFDFHVWTRNQTSLQSALYDEGWQPRFGGADYTDVYVASTQERLTEERFYELRAEPGALSVQAEFIPEAEIVMGIQSPLGIITSDGGGLVDGTGHPRSVATFARFLGRYVRDQEVVGWMEGIKRITLLPAQRVEKAMPAMARKGRIQVGMDADLTIFDPATVQERATYAEPDQRSAGIPYVIINGVLVIDAGEPVADVAPGKWLGQPRG